MTEEEGARVTARRVRLGWTVVRLAQEAGVHRSTVSALESGQGVQSVKRGKILSALDAGEAEAGMSEMPPEEMPHTIQAGLIEFEITGDFGVRVVARGPVADHELLAADVARIIRDIRATPTTTGPAQGSAPED